MPAIIVQPPETLAGNGETPMVERAYRCTGCGRRRTFAAPTERLIGQQLACAGWKIDGMHHRVDCPDCWMVYERSVMVGARGNS